MGWQNEEDPKEKTGGHVERALEIALKLKSIAPNHDLLKFIFHADVEDVWKKFLEQFGQATSEDCADHEAIERCWTRYHEAMQNELEKVGQAQT